ncbi:DNA polymerase III subunit epsilon [Arenimonas sp. MALMAid1274]|uniref:DNA polymerase III subunit epsilon n=1 Tax=Arenimonas sp. MALMAid1274 TaxID=3411630 RepID=UPI003BA185E7
MRQIVLDTETTGLSWEKGNRIVEVGCIELLERRPTGRQFQRYFNPGREMEPGAQEVTGLSLDFLRDKPRFEDVLDELLDFIRGAELIIHNASFDVGFLNYELSLAGAHYGRLDQHASVLDTLAMARERYPGQRNSLDALCKRLGVDNGHRKLHGALLDAELLAEVYLGMTAGQGDLGLAPAGGPRAAAATSLRIEAGSGQRRVLRASETELAAHEARLARIAAKAGKRLWPETAA